ncbi:MAG: sensor histidine kinase [Alkalilacustris sp.]
MLGAGPLLGPRLRDRLAVRLAILLSVALLPLGAIAVDTTLRTLNDARSSADQALVGLTAEAVAGQRALIESTLASGATLGAPAVGRLDDLAACSELLEDFVRRSGVFLAAGLIETDGRMRCASTGEARDFSDHPAFRILMNRPAAMVAAADSGVISRRPVLVVAQPIRDGDTLQGFMAVSIDQEAVALMGRMGAGRDEDAPRHTILVNRYGDIVSAGTTPDGLLPEGRSLQGLIEDGTRVFSATARDGERATYAMVPLMPGMLYALGVWPGGAGAAASGGAGLAAVAVPLLMWIASLGVAYLAVYRLVIRHIRSLNRQMRRFALGHRDTPPPILADAPAELREVSATFNKLARILARDEAELEASLAEKTVLLKEVHHRVKNNLQLIASILNLQMRQVRDPAARRVLRSVQDRVLGLATIHRSLYQSERLAAVRADRLVDEIVRQLLSIGVAPGSAIAVRTDLAPMTLSPDRLVPLSLLLTEAVTNALKYTGRPEAGPHKRPWLQVTLSASGSDSPDTAADAQGAVTLTVRNSLGAPLPGIERDDTGSTRLGAELIEAFAQQLDARLTQGEEDGPDGRIWSLSVTFGAEDPAPLPTPAADPVTA